MEPDVRPGRWLMAIVIGLVVWAAASSLAPPIGANTAIAPVLAILPGIVMAGLLVGARSAGRWLRVALLVTSLAIAISLALVVLFLGGL